MCWYTVCTADLVLIGSTIVLQCVNKADNNLRPINTWLLSFLQHKVSVSLALVAVHSVLVVLGADRRKPQGTCTYKVMLGFSMELPSKIAPILGHLIWDVSDWLVGVYLKLVVLVRSAHSDDVTYYHKIGQPIWVLGFSMGYGSAMLGYAVQVNWPTLHKFLTELVHGSFVAQYFHYAVHMECLTTNCYILSMYGLPWKLLAPLHNITTK